MDTMNFGSAQPHYFESEDEISDDLENQTAFDRVDKWLTAKQIVQVEAQDQIEEFFDQARRKTFSEYSQDFMSINDSSPFLLSSPLTSSIILERQISKKEGDLEQILKKNSYEFGSDKKYCKSMISQNKTSSNEQQETRTQK